MTRSLSRGRPRSCSFGRSALLGPIVLLMLSSCTITVNPLEEVDRFSFATEDGGPVVLAQKSDDDGRVSTYSIPGQTRRFPESDDQLTSAVLVSTTHKSGVPYLGVRVSSIKSVEAEAYDLEAWRGVRITETIEGGAAEAAGLESGNLILRIDQADVVSAEQFTDHIASRLSPGQRIVLAVDRATATAGERERVEIDVVVGTREIEETESNRVDAPLNPPLIKGAGLGVATIPPKLSTDIWGIEATTPLITSVVTGSPAYFAGFRSGDRVVLANGSPVTTTEDLLDRTKEGGSRLTLAVDGALGPHEGTFDIQADALNESDFHIPILVDYARRPDRTRLSVLDFIFQFGFNKRTEYGVSRTRTPLKSSELSILPLGMFEFTRSPKKSKNRIFWLISWSSKR